MQLSDPELVTVVQTLEKTADVPVGFSATIQQEKQPETPGKSIPASVQGLRLSPAAYGLMREFGVAAPVVPQFVVLPSQSDRTPAGFDDSNQEAQATWAVARVGRLIAQTAVIDMAIFLQFFGWLCLCLESRRFRLGSSCWSFACCFRKRFLFNASMKSMARPGFEI